MRFLKMRLSFSNAGTGWCCPKQVRAGIQREQCLKFSHRCFAKVGKPLLIRIQSTFCRLRSYRLPTSNVCMLRTDGIDAVQNAARKNRILDRSVYSGQKSVTQEMSMVRFFKALKRGVP